MQQAIDSLKIKTVIRLNGDFEKDNGGVKIDDEKYLCEHQNDDVKFYEINFYSTDALNRIHNILMEGNTLIHCKHGYDRTGAAVGYHLRKDGYSLWDVVIHNKWEDYRNKKSEKYLTDYWEVIL